jgi:hypothetical protein
MQCLLRVLQAQALNMYVSPCIAIGSPAHNTPIATPHIVQSHAMKCRHHGTIQLLLLQASTLAEPWCWLLPAAVAAGAPVLDPRFNFIFTAAPAATPATPAAGANAAAVVAPPGLPMDQLLGQQPVLGRPPFLGPLVRKLAGAQQQLGSLTPTTSAATAAAAAVSATAAAAAAVWDDATWCKLFVLLADNPPRDLQPAEVSFLRSLPMFRRLKVQRAAAAAASMAAASGQYRQQQQEADGWLQDEDLLVTDGLAAAGEAEVEGAAAAAAAAATGRGQLVALGEDSRWVLAPQAVVQECQGKPAHCHLAAMLQHNKLCSCYGLSANLCVALGLLSTVPERHGILNANDAAVNKCQQRLCHVVSCLPVQQGLAAMQQHCLNCSRQLMSSTAASSAGLLQLCIVLNHAARIRINIFTTLSLATPSYVIAGLFQLQSLPPGCTSHILEHRPTWGELYYILGLSPASLADFLQALLLPHLLKLSLADRQIALSFIQQHWSNSRWQLGSDEAFVAALSAIAFVPAKQAPAAAAGSSAAAARAAAAADGAGSTASSSAAAAAAAKASQVEQLYLAKQLFDPTVPLFAKVMATMGVAALGAAAATVAAAGGGGLALFPAAPYDSPGWLQVGRYACICNSRCADPEVSFVAIHTQQGTCQRCMHQVPILRAQHVPQCLRVCTQLPVFKVDSALL